MSTNLEYETPSAGQAEGDFSIPKSKLSITGGADSTQAGSHSPAEQAGLEQQPAQTAQATIEPSAKQTTSKQKPATQTGFEGIAQLFESTNPFAFKPTDDGNAEFFANMFRQVLRYNASTEKWMIWDGNLWRVDQKEEVVNFAKHAARVRLAIAEKLPEENKTKATSISYALKCQSAASLYNTVRLARPHRFFSTVGADWNNDPWLFVAANGVINLKTFEFRPGQPSDMISRGSPVRYDPKARCPQWEKFNGEIFEGPDEAREAQKASGYCLTGDRTEQKNFGCIGQGSNGKGVFLDTLEAVMGGVDTGYSDRMEMSSLDESATARTKVSNDIAKLVGKRFVIAAETQAGRRIDVAKVKMLTGESRRTARFLHREHFQYVPQDHIWLSVNHLPAANDDSDGYWRRQHIWNFPHKFEGRSDDKALKEKLLAELPGILNWLLAGLKMWHKEGLKRTRRMAELVAAYREENDLPGQFIAETFVIEAGSHLLVSTLRENSKLWQREVGCKFKPTALRTALRHRGCQEIKVGKNRDRAWSGLRLATVADREGVDALDALDHAVRD